MDIDRQAILDVFLADAGEYLDIIERCLIALEEDPDDHEHILELFRVVHTVKGDAAMLELNGLRDFAHALESLMEPLRNSKINATQELITLLLRAADTVSELLAMASTGETELLEHHKEVLDAIGSFVGAGTHEPNAATVDDCDHAQSPKQGTGSGQNRTLRVHLDSLDQMFNLAGEIAVARGRMLQALLDLPESDSRDRLLEIYRDGDRSHGELQELAAKVRMVPVGATFYRYTRVVRDAALGVGKQARLVVEGADVEIDDAVIANLRDPLTHMVRNAIDHGLETPEERIAAGKNPTGTVTLRAFHASGGVVVEIQDDGAGIDTKGVRSKLESERSPDDVTEITDGEVLEQVFEAGFSTAESVSQLSGRGVGLDVVKRNVQGLRGSIAIQSERGVGTTFAMQFPLTLAAIDGFTVEVDGEIYIFPLETVTECVEAPAALDRNACNEGIISLRSQPLPFVRLRSLFDNMAQSTVKRESLVIVQADGMRAGIAVDKLHGVTRAVIKPMTKPLHDIDCVSGSAILGSGRVALVLNVPSTLRTALDRTSSIRSSESKSENSDTSEKTLFEASQKDGSPSCNP